LFRLTTDDCTCPGTGAQDPHAISCAVRNAVDLADHCGLDLRILDVGGGFSNSNFASFAEHLNTAMSYARQVFPQVQVIAEPGRYLACSSFTICCQVIGRRANAEPPRLYVNDGVYGNFMNAIMEQEKYQPVAVFRQGWLHDQDHTGKRVYSIWGQTCDSIDRIATEACFDREIRVGDWLVFADMGAYTSACQTRFNGFDARRTPTLYIE
jgi:ornithine decarboxylase